MNTDKNMIIVDHLIDEATGVVFSQWTHILVKTFETVFTHQSYWNEAIGNIVGMVLDDDFLINRNNTILTIKSNVAVDGPSWSIFK